MSQLAVAKRFWLPQFSFRSVELSFIFVRSPCFLFLLPLSSFALLFPRCSSLHILLSVFLHFSFDCNFWLNFKLRKKMWNDFNIYIRHIVYSLAFATLITICCCDTFQVCRIQSVLIKLVHLFVCVLSPTRFIYCASSSLFFIFYIFLLFSPHANGKQLNVMKTCFANCKTPFDIISAKIFAFQNNRHRPMNCLLCCESALFGATR